MSAADAGVTCDHCDRDIVGRVVNVKVDGAARQFCCDACGSRWALDQIVRLRRFCRRIWLTTRGRARELANAALNTDTQP